MEKILLVDDDMILREVLRTSLERMGHKVFTASDGKEALALCERVRPEIMITDILMPELGGLETIRALRDIANNLPIIAMSGGLPEVGADKILALAQILGAQCVLSKPFHTSELAAAIQEVRKKRAESAA